jgi:hypothetical protein
MCETYIDQTTASLAYLKSVAKLINCRWQTLAAQPQSPTTSKIRQCFKDNIPIENVPTILMEYHRRIPSNW